MASSRPSDAISADPEDRVAENPQLGPIGFARFLWRQLTSMRTALVLLLLLALAAVPGSLVPQRSSDPNGVFQYAARDPEGFKILDALGLFSTFSSPWFSAIYLLLFVSLIGCIIPRTKHHLGALLARPPKTPARLARLVGFTTAETTVDAETAVVEARRVLKSQGYRVERYGDSISAERGYLRETGNLIFHTALVGVLAAVGLGGAFGYTGQRLLIEGEPFTNVLADYDSFSGGTWVDPDTSLAPFSLRLDSFDPEYTFRDGSWHPLDYDANVSVRQPGGDWTDAVIKVNSPLDVGGSQVYLLGNGYAPIVTIRDPEGVEVFSGAVPFLAEDANLRSFGVIKVPDGLSAQLGLTGFFYPDAYETESGVFASFSPLLTDNALLTLFVYRGDLGLADGSGANVYSLDTTDMEQLAGREDALALQPGDTVDLSDGMGTIELEGVAEYVGLDIHSDPAQAWVLGFALAAVFGLLTSLFIPRRRMWIKVLPGDGVARLEYAGLARGEDPALAAAVADLAQAHAEALDRKLDGMTPETLAAWSLVGVYSAAVVYVIAFVVFALDLAKRSAEAAPASSRSALGESLAASGSTAVLIEAPPAPPAVAGASRNARVALALTAVGLAVHVAAIVLRGIAAERVPWANMFEFALTGTGIIVAVFVFANLWRDLRFLGAYVTALAALLLTLATINFYDAVGLVPLPPPLQSAWLVIHVLVAILGTGFFSLGAGLSVAQLIQSRREAGKFARLTFMSTIPSSENLERLAYRVNVIGFMLWTFTLIFGAIWAERAWGRYWGWDTKEVWTFVIWVVFAGYIHARATRGWRGTPSAVLAIIGFAAVLFNFTVVNLFFTGLHAYSGL